jgi:hypothetical protein
MTGRCVWPRVPDPATPPTDEGGEASGGVLTPVEGLVGRTGETVGRPVEDVTDTLGDAVGGVDALLAAEDGHLPGAG